MLEIEHRRLFKTFKDKMVCKEWKKDDQLPFLESQQTNTINMGMKWGNMATNVRGLVMYSLSPYEQKAFAGAFSQGVPNMFRRFRGQVFRVVPPFIGGYLIYQWAQEEHERLMRKDPKEFLNDE
ncbi:hypothetical protein RRG08_040130 [Elysia crispata]|uniref:Cytochrome b-c1 complex subunit 8 n=1 Tax=Elysia crispata TaxID=231223 RepID=A0AAE0XWI2_9GAST|nr:hypothetical protein RRG08_040130 [Elysia crispata]